MDENGKPIYDEPAVLKHSTKVRPYMCGMGYKCVDLGSIDGSYENITCA